MRIGILTFHKVINYGAYLQAFSLSNKLQKEFPDDDVEIIDFIAHKQKKRERFMLLWNVKHHGIKGGISELKKRNAFGSAHKFLSLSPKTICTKNLNKLYSYIDERYDVLIIGSDAVFNWNQTNFPTPFIPDYKFSIPVYTYAASVHGLKFLKEEKDKIEKCGEAFNSMKLIGVRDACTENFVKYCSNKGHTIHCCDPTLFIDKDRIYCMGNGVEEKIKQRYNFSLDSKYIVVMAPDSEMIKQISEKYGKDYKIVSVFVKSAYSDIYISDLDPFEWTAILKKAAVVVTSYFHGTLLSLVQGTPTIVLDYSGYCDEHYEGKLKDLMITRLDLPELYFDKEYAENFKEDIKFYDKFDELLSGEYKDKIEIAVLNEGKTIDFFVDTLKQDFLDKK